MAEVTEREAMLRAAVASFAAGWEEFDHCWCIPKAAYRDVKFYSDGSSHQVHTEIGERGLHAMISKALEMVSEAGLAEGRKQGLEEAAMRCEELVTGGTYAVEQAADEQCNECAKEIRALKEKA